jgi:hypothetical protein
MQAPCLPCGTDFGDGSRFWSLGSGKGLCLVMTSETTIIFKYFEILSIFSELIWDYCEVYELCVPLVISV